ncbi:hypothetical protein C9F11_25550 [Streptomyces sp. YIM 121038]|uniref:hypothetical protein n=1 Tax=Streptomyces sp. YIM 121038 TaxID=2136401 RepID=UPI001110F41C|nr:hypothetical protein [Streptomyces sp. YIM 121038]QCX78721.1 hypothetical protein C9F11_25550 [Streptomyces sp. YIM 121038]
MTDRTERDEILDFPGADELVAAGAVAPPPAAVVAAARERWARRTESEQAADTGWGVPLVVIGSGEPSGTAARRSRRPRRRVLAAVAAAAAVVVAGAVARPVPDADGTPASAPTMSTTAFLNTMAGVASDQPELKPGAYWMVRAETTGRGARSWYSDFRGHTWEAGPRRTVNGKGQSVGPWTVGPRSLSGNELEKLDTDPDKLIDGFSKAPARRFEEVMDLLAESPARPWLRFALFKVLARIPGVEVGGTVRDSRGRPGKEVTFTGGAAGRGPAPERLWARCVIDPRTSRVLEDRSGTSTGRAYRKTFLEIGWTDRVA